MAGALMISMMIDRAFSTATRTVRNETWDVGDEVFAIRPWGEEDHLYFPAGVEWTLGSSASCDLRLDAPGVSRHHATVTRVGTYWHIHDRASKNGVMVDGRRVSSARLDPGVVLTLGDLRLVAASCRLRALREFLFCIMGWRPTMGAVVDETAQDIRFALLRRDPIVLSGRGGIPLAKQMAEILLGADIPFALYSTKREDSDEGSVRALPNARSLSAAIEMARGGAVCFAGALSREFVQTVSQLQTWRERPPVMFVCFDGPLDSRVLRTAPPIRLPEIQQRSRKELDFAMTCYLRSLAREWGAQHAIPERVRHWAMANAETLPELQKCLRRVVALREAGTILGAAKLLRMAPVSLRRWFHRHPLPELRSQ
jgi:hypothetical protein